MKINEKEYTLKFTGLTLVIYREEFGKDFLNVITNLQELTKDYTQLLEIAWALVKTCDDNTLPYREWCNSITNITNIISKDAVNEIVRCINNDSKTTVVSTEDVKKKEAIE